MKTENKFLEMLEKKAKEQEKLMETELMPQWAKGVGEWLVVNPWRVLIPIAVLVYGGMRMVGGGRVRELILKIFGGY